MFNSKKKVEKLTIKITKKAITPKMQGKIREQKNLAKELRLINACKDPHEKEVHQKRYDKLNHRYNKFNLFK